MESCEERLMETTLETNLKKQAEKMEKIEEDFTVVKKSKVGR